MEQDRREFTEFYTEARDDCLRAVLINVADRDLAEDLVAEDFTKAWRALADGAAAPRAPGLDRAHRAAQRRELPSVNDQERIR